jgi:hypothetical protein
MYERLFHIGICISIPMVMKSPPSEVEGEAITRTRIGVSLVSTSSLALLVTSFLPWFQTGWAESVGRVDYWRTNTANAWQSSSLWTIAIMASLSAALAAVVASPDRAPGVMRSLRWYSAVLATAAIGLTVWQWRSIGPPDMSGGSAWTLADPDVPETQVGDIVRDHLVSVHVDGLTHEVGWGFFVGVAAMAFVAGGSWILTTISAEPHGRTDVSSTASS